MPSLKEFTRAKLGWREKQDEKRKCRYKIAMTIYFSVHQEDLNKVLSDPLYNKLIGTVTQLLEKLYPLAEY
jgi:hypothetical protein